jgi:hypothetical protein
MMVESRQRYSLTMVRDHERPSWDRCRAGVAMVPL